MATGIEAEPSYAQVMSVYKRRTFALCGVSSVYTGRLLSWVERLALLVDQGQLIDAITLATGLYRGHTGQVVIGLPRSQRDGDAHEKKRQTMVGGKLVELMRGSLGLMFGGSDNELEPGSYQRQHEHWKRSDSEISALISVCVEACLETENTALLFGDIFERYSASSKPFIISGQIQRLPPQILNAMVDRYGGTPQLVRRLGEILSSLHLNQGDFDIDRVLSSCRRHGLWRTFARVWLGMGDPIAPVHCMIDAATKSGKDTESTHEASWASFKDVRDSDEAPDTVVFDYMDMVIRGRFYPGGQPIKPQGRAEKYSTLITELVFPPVDTSRAPENIRKSYRTLLALLDLDAERLLYTLKRVLSDPFIDFINLIIKPADTGKAAQYSDRSLRRASQVKSFPQIVVDTLFVLTTASGTSNSATLLTKRQIGLLSSFALTLYATRFPLIFLRDDRVTEWTDVLLRLDDTSTLSEREYAFELLFKLNPPQSYADCIGRVRQAGFFRVLEHIYCAVEQYGMALQTYLDHPDYAYHRAVFAAIRELAASKGDMALADITEFVRSRAVELVDTDAKKFVDTVESVGFLEHATIFDALGNHPQAQFAYLRALLDPTPNSLSRSPECLCMLPASAVSDERAPPNIVAGARQLHKTNKYPQQYHEQYLELMCQFNPGSVLQYLKQHVDLSPEPFRLSYVQAVCDKHGVSDGLVWALVRLGDFSGALDTLLAQTDQEVESVKAAVPVGDAANGELGIAAETREAWLLVSKRQRWMLHSALDVLISAASPASSLISLRHIIQQLLASGTVAPAESAPPGSVRSLDIAEIQHLLAVAVSAYKTEAQLMVLTNVLVDHDLFTTLGQLVRSQKQGWFVPSDTTSTSADTGSALAKCDVGSLYCGKCSDQLFVDRRQDRAMADRRKQMVQYLGPRATRCCLLAP
ncbi:Golgi CORVET complex core vacuolar protein 8-domain-containing protein [Kickxella alabastrina]|uniref:Golgi CORVET complex core vacuolar protein 8-domain-containing protein n=1 Tax=Kickxella alabastrina TaxID=61397 RepID=UPI00221F45FA|nr:Golgi CORVET complex core vacuolar protein 8-domain-containing protein [Kickxella alabastrina]KAI7829051.1 Golgi CORVET complex core vacuolar protein 8-domain-containing protein [Kickxella alabastrina]